jgi:Uncharacterized conserved protein
MARPKTKEDLIKEGNGQFENMWNLIETITIENQNGTFEFDGKEAHWKRDKNIRDILIHLYEWHELLLKWVASNHQGLEKPFLPTPYSWKNYGKMNIEFWHKHQKTSYESSKKLVNDTHQKVIELINQFTAEELFSKGIFNWVGGSTLGQYFISTTVAHYDWAITKIKKYKKELS